MLTVQESRTMDSIQEINRKLPDLELRDLFAMNIAAGFNRGSLWTSGDFENLAKKIYELADAMIKARKIK